MPINVTENINKVASTIQQKISAESGTIQNAISSASKTLAPKLTEAEQKVQTLLNSNTLSSAPTTPDNLGITKAQAETFTNGAARDILITPDAPAGAPTQKIKNSVPILLQTDVRAIMLQIASMETSNSNTYDAAPYLGKYAAHSKTLTNYGYLDSEGNYTGKDGIKTKEEFLFDANVQDRIMEKFLLDQYKALVKNGGIKDNDTKEIVAGMVTVAYQFQDAGPGANSLTDIDSSALVSSASSLADNLKTANAPGSGATGAQIESLVNSSGVLKQSESLLSKNPAETIKSLKSGDSLTKTVNSSVQSLKDTATTAAASVKETLEPAATEMAATLKKQAATIDIAKLKSAASDLAVALPAGKAKDWRNTGSINDSKGRPGSLFFNAGRYAVKTLAADVPVPG